VSGACVQVRRSIHALHRGRSSERRVAKFCLLASAFHLPVEIQLLAFAQARDLLGFASRAISCAPDETPRAIVSRVAMEAPIAQWRVALDGEYADWDAPIGAARELAIIPPVSGG
jgi:sulfur-carrier protein